MSDDQGEVVKPPYSVAAEVARLITSLRQVPILKQITHEEIGEIIKEDAISPRGRAIVRKARLRLENEESIVFRTINKIGLERCDDIGKPDLAKSGIKSVRRKVRRSEVVLNAVALEELEEANRTQYVLNKVLLSMLRQASNGGFGRALQKRLSDSSANLESVNLLRLFGKVSKEE